MTKTHMTKRDALRAARARRKVYNRVIIIGLVVVVLAAIIWMVILELKSRNGGETPTTQSNTTPESIGTQTAQSNVTPELVGTKQYSSAPPMLIDETKQYFATVKMAKGGEFVIQLYPDKAPITVNSFVFLARQGYYDGTTFHRVLEGFMAQGGDPTGTGSGDPGYSFVNETNDLKFDKAGVVAMANAGRNTNGSQFFIMFGAYGLSEDDYTIFGQVISGMDVVNGITRRDPDKNPTFTGDIIESITITEK
jgi:cyclophilin family peptidyl-prolyl cis-trans isomerase